MDYLFWGTPAAAYCDMFPWILWYTWKARNGKFFENEDTCPMEILRMAETEEKAWSLAQIAENTEVLAPEIGVQNIPERGLQPGQISSGYKCFVDGSWKDNDNFSGLGWYCLCPDEVLPSMRAANLRRSLTPLHAEVEALVWAMRCMIGHDRRDVTFLTDCSDLVKMVSNPLDWPAFAIYLEAIQSDRGEFSSFSLFQVPRQENVNADRLARNVRTHPHIVTYVNDCPQQ